MATKEEIKALEARQFIEGATKAVEAADILAGPDVPDISDEALQQIGKVIRESVQLGMIHTAERVALRLGATVGEVVTVVRWSGDGCPDEPHAHLRIEVEGQIPVPAPTPGLVN